MIFLFLIVLCCVVIFQFFIVYCRSLLAEFARIAISPDVMTDLSIKEDEASGDDFSRLAALARLCQDTEEVYRLHFVQFYYRVLTALYRIPAGPESRFAKLMNRERRACTHFAAVIIERRIAGARQIAESSRDSR
jgi:hypothetical protein